MLCSVHSGGPSYADWANTKRGTGLPSIPEYPAKRGQPTDGSGDVGRR